MSIFFGNGTAWYYIILFSRRAGPFFTTTTSCTSYSYFGMCSIPCRIRKSMSQWVACNHATTWTQTHLGFCTCCCVTKNVSKLRFSMGCSTSKVFRDSINNNRCCMVINILINTSSFIGYINSCITTPRCSTTIS